MNHRAVLLLYLLTCLAAVSGCAEDTNSAVQTPDKPAVAVAEQTNAVPNRSKPERVAQLGDPAPPLMVLEWIKGQPVKIKPGTNIYVLVFCTLSRANDFALTNLSALQKDYQNKGVVVVAISDEGPDQLKEFLQVKGDEINFTMAADDLPGRTAKNYQHIFRQFQLPRAFVVGTNGEVLWFGHPLRDGLGEVVDDITSGRYNRAQTQKTILTREQMEQYLLLARQNDARNERVGRMLFAIRTNDAAGLCDLASKIATDPLIDKRDVALASAALDRAAQLTTTNATDIAVTRAILLFQTGKEDEGLAKAREALATAQSQDAKDEVQICIHAMEARLAAAKTNEISAPTNVPSGKP